MNAFWLNSNAKIIKSMQYKGISLPFFVILRKIAKKWQD